MTADPKYHRWFDLGAKKFRGWAEARGLEVPTDEPLYPCPLCLPISKKVFPREDLYEGVLTAEDVPPESVGGKKIILTCKPCNNNQGSKIDVHAGRRERFVDSITGVRIKPLTGEHTVGGVTVRGDVLMGPGQIGIEYVPKQNNPNEFEAYKQAILDAAIIKNNIYVNARFSWDKAELSDIRAAYLASFAAFGWTHVLRPAFLPLLKRLAGEDIELPEHMSRYDLAETSKKNTLLLITEEGPQQGIVMVQMARATVVLPGPWDDRTLDEVAEVFKDLVPDGESRLFDGVTLTPAWPTRPEHQLDPDPVAELEPAAESA